MSKVRRETYSCTGRGFSMLQVDGTGYLSRLMSFATRPNVHGSTVAITSSTWSLSNFNLVGHGLSTGQSVVLTGGTVPPELTLSISLAYPVSRLNIYEYFVIKISNDIFQLAKTHYDAMLSVPVPVTFTSDISGVSVTPLGGGANWYLHDDFSRMVSKNFATTDVNTGTGIITVTGHGFSHMHKVTFSSTGAVPSPLVAGTAYWIIWVSANTFKVASTEAYAFAGTAITLTNVGSGTHTITTAEHFVIITDTLLPSANDYNTSPAGCAPKYLKLGYLNSESGYVRKQACLWWDNVDHVGRVIWAGNRMDTYDTAVFAYQFIAGDEFFLIASQLGSSWFYEYIDTFTGITSKLEPITKVGILQSGITAGSNVVISLGFGQASNFTVDKFYYIYDFIGHGWVNYVKVTARDIVLDTVTIDSCDKNFPTGSVLISYAHRYYVGGYQVGVIYAATNMCYGVTGQVSSPNWTIPYCSSLVESEVIHPQTTPIYLTASFPNSSMSTDYYLEIGDPDDEGDYDCMRHLIGELCSASNVTYTSMNRIYGKSDNIIKTARGTMGQMVNTRTMLGIDYLNFTSSSSAYVDMITYTESAI